MRDAKLWEIKKENRTAIIPAHIAMIKLCMPDFGTKTKIAFFIRIFIREDFLLTHYYTQHFCQYAN